MTNRNATSVVFGWDFQVNAAIVIMLENIKELTSIRLEGKNEDIEIDLNDGSCILAQAKSVVRSSEDFTHVLDNLKKSLKSLSEAYRDRKSVKKLIYITNSPNPLSVTKEQFIFAGFPTRRKYESLPEKSRKQIDKILKNIEIPLDTSNLTIQTLPFETDDDNEKYKFVLEAIREFISQFNSNNKISKVNLHQVWTNDIFKSGSKKDTSLNLSKKDLIWPIIVTVTSDIESESEWDEAIFDEISRAYKDIINTCCEKYEFMTSILSEYNDYQTDKNYSERSKNFIQNESSKFAYILDDKSLTLDNSLRETLLKVIIKNIINKRYQIDQIKSCVNL